MLSDGNQTLHRRLTVIVFQVGMYVVDLVEQRVLFMLFEPVMEVCCHWAWGTVPLSDSFNKWFGSPVVVFRNCHAHIENKPQIEWESRLKR